VFSLKPSRDACAVLSILTPLGPPGAPRQMLETLGSVCWAYGLETVL